MKEWTREERYRVLHDPEEIRDLYESIRTSVYRQRYHIQPVTGLSSDPNGFVYHQGVWHLYYQWCPWGAVHGLKYWYHVSSKDLIHWKNEGVGLWPDRDFDNRGTHSGSAISDGENLTVFYTGNHRDEDWTRTPYTCAAVMDDEGTLVKLDAPLFGPRQGYSEHQRDPKVLWNREQQCWYIFIGAQREDLSGTALIYRSKELFSGWEFLGELHVPGYEHFAGMWECPCIATIGGKDVLIFSPQYTKLPGRGNTTNHNIYFLGTMDYDTLTFTPEGDYRFLDYGFDFYAAQFAANVPYEDKAVMVSWIGLPDNHYPTAEEDADYEGSMTLVRELTLEDGTLKIRPVEGIESLREEALPDEGLLPKAGELRITPEAGDFSLNLFTDGRGSRGFSFTYDAKTKTCLFDKTGLSKRFNETVFETLEMPLDKELSSLRIFIDSSSVEFFVNDGEKTFSAHVYPEKEETHYELSGGSIRIWSYKDSVRDDFAI